MDDRMFQSTIQAMREALRSGRIMQAIAAMADLHPVDQAEVFRRLDPSDQALLLPHLTDSAAADLLEELDDQEAAMIAEALEPGRLADILDEMEPDEAADVLGDITPPRAAAALAEMRAPEDIRPLLDYADETAGGLMTTAYIAMSRDTTAAETIRVLRRRVHDTETPYYLYVVDADQRLLGVVGLRSLVVAAPQARLAEIMDHEVLSVSIHDDQEEVARIIARYDLAAVPVVDEHHILRGVVTYDDVIDVLEDEATQDLLQMGAITAGEISDRPYWTLRTAEIVRSRFVWLLILFLAQTLTSAVMRHFQSDLQAAIALSFFIPLLIGTGGNAGSQTVTTVIRALALKEVHRRDTLRVVLRELHTGSLLGLLLGAVAFLWVMMIGMEPPLALVVAITVLAICIWANIVGSLVPIFASLIGVDPTVMSAPLISTLVDATGLIIYFTVAILVLGR
jgi:magnesium transporter